MSDVKNSGILRLILFGAVFLLLLTAASALSTPVKWFDDNRVQNRNARITEMMKQEPYTVDVLNMGDSLSLSSLTPMEMWRQKGYTSFNIGADGIRMPEVYYTILRATEEQDVKYLLFETLPLFRYNDKQDKQMILSQPLYHWFAFLKYHSIWKPYIEGRGIKIYHKGYLINREIQEYQGDPDYMDQELGNVRTQIADFNRTWFRKVKKYCDEKGIKLILYSDASPKNYNWTRVNNIAEFAREEGVEYIDMNQLADEIGINWKTDSNDRGDHMNLDGVIKMTTFFGDYFSREGILADHRGDPAYSSWDEELAAYDKLVDEMEGISFFQVQKRIEKERKEEKEKAKEQ